VTSPERRQRRTRRGEECLLTAGPKRTTHVHQAHMLYAFSTTKSRQSAVLHRVARGMCKNFADGSSRFGLYTPCIRTNLYSAKNRENQSEALAQDDWTVQADWKRWNFRWRLKVDRVSTERMCASREFQLPSRRCRRRKGPRGKVASNTTVHGDGIPNGMGIRLELGNGKEWECRNRLAVEHL